MSSAPCTLKLALGFSCDGWNAWKKHWIRGDIKTVQNIWPIRSTVEKPAYQCQSHRWGSASFSSYYKICKQSFLNICHHLWPNIYLMKCTRTETRPPAGRQTPLHVLHLRGQMTPHSLSLTCLLGMRRHNRGSESLRYKLRNYLHYTWHLWWIKEEMDREKRGSQL